VTNEKKYWGIDELATVKKVCFKVCVKQMADVRAIAYFQKKQIQDVVTRALELLIAEATADADIEAIRQKHNSFLKRHAPKL